MPVERPPFDLHETTPLLQPIASDSEGDASRTVEGRNNGGRYVARADRDRTSLLISYSQGH